MSTRCVVLSIYETMCDLVEICYDMMTQSRRDVIRCDVSRRDVISIDEILWYVKSRRDFV